MFVFPKSENFRAVNQKALGRPINLPLKKLLLVQLICLTGITGACADKEKKQNEELRGGKERGVMVTRRDNYNTGRLTARPKNNTAKDNFTTGVQPLQLDGKRDGFIYVPKSYKPDKPAALAIMLHGAGGQAEHG